MVLDVTRGEPAHSAMLLRRLYDDHYQRLVSLARLLGADDPEDAVAEGFVRLHSRLGRYQGEQAQVAFLRVTVANLAKNRRAHLLMARQVNKLQAPVVTEPGFAEGVVVSDVVRRAIADLSLRHRQVLVLRYWLDRSTGQISALLRVSEGTVKAHLSRARAIVAQALAEGESS